MDLALWGLRREEVGEMCVSARDYLRCGSVVSWCLYKKEVGRLWMKGVIGLGGDIYTSPSRCCVVWGVLLAAPVLGEDSERELSQAFTLSYHCMCSDWHGAKNSRCSPQRDWGIPRLLELCGQ